MEEKNNLDKIKVNNSNNSWINSLIMLSSLNGDYSININDFKFDDNDKEKTE